MKCKICSKEFKTIQALSSHIGWHNKPERISKLVEYNKQVKNGEKIRKSSNQYIKAKELGLPKPKISIERRKQISEQVRERNLIYFKSSENKEKQSKSMKKAVLNNPDSYSSSNVSGRVKSYIFIDGYGNKTTLKGKWELKVAYLLNEKNIKWTNKIEPSLYYWNNDWHFYFPDFYLPDKNLYLEIKGYQRDRDIEKWKYFKEKLLIIKKNEINNLENWFYNNLINN